MARSKIMTTIKKSAKEFGSKRFLYVSWSVLPSAMANAVQVIRMVNALAESDEVEVELIARRSNSRLGRNNEIARHVGLDDRVKLTLLSQFRIIAAFQLIKRIHSRSAQQDLMAIYSRVLPIFWLKLAPPYRIFEIHEPPSANWCLKEFVFERCARYSGFTDLVCISGNLKGIVESKQRTALQVGQVKCTVLPSGGANPLPYTDESNENPVRIAYAGHMNKLHRGILKEIAESFPDIVIDLYGASSPRVEGLSSLPNVEFHGWLQPEELNTQLLLARILIAPYANLSSTEWLSPVKIFDYAALGRPMLVSDTPAIRDIFPDGSIGRLLSQNNPREWVEGLEELLSSPELRLSMGQAGPVFAAKYCFAERARRVLDLVGIRSRSELVD